jgi:predicted RNA polymerase sigma factor
MLIRRGQTALKRAEAAGGAPGPYMLQACIAACHARARTADETDWRLIAAYYSVLSVAMPSPVVDLNRAMAVSMAFGPAAGLQIVDELVEEGALRAYHLLPSARADLLFKLGRYAEAKSEFERAAAMTRNGREQALLLDRARESAEKV